MASVNMTTPIRIYPSSLSGYADCPRRTAANMFRRRIEAAGFTLAQSRQNIGAAVGTAFHSGAEYTLKDKARTGEMPSASATTDLVVDTLRKKASEGVIYDALAGNLNTAEKQAVRIMGKYREAIAPFMSPMLTEGSLQLDVGGGFLLAGRIDVLDQFPLGITDYKSGKMKTSYLLQMGSYSFMARQKKWEIEQLRVDFIQRVALDKEQPEPVTDIIDRNLAEHAAASVIRRVKQDYGEFENRAKSGKAPPEFAFTANPGSMMCNPKFCTAWGTAFCREHANNQPD